MRLMSKESESQMDDKIEALRAFIARRFDEISMEIDATSQLMDMAQDGMTERFGGILNALKAVTFSGDGSTPHNVGMELDAVVRTTEEAANTIMDAADQVSKIVDSEAIDWADDMQRESALERIRLQADTIVMACSFQDITGQRIRMTLANIADAQEQLSSTLGALGVDVKKVTEDNKKSDDFTTPTNSQSDIDALFD